MIVCMARYDQTSDVGRQTIHGFLVCRRDRIETEQDGQLQFHFINARQVVANYRSTFPQPAITGIPPFDDSFLSVENMLLCGKHILCLAQYSWIDVDNDDMDDDDSTVEEETWDCIFLLDCNQQRVVSQYMLPRQVHGIQLHGDDSGYCLEVAGNSLWHGTICFYGDGSMIISEPKPAPHKGVSLNEMNQYLEGQLCSVWQNQIGRDYILRPFTGTGLNERVAVEIRQKNEPTGRSRIVDIADISGIEHTRHVIIQPGLGGVGFFKDGQYAIILLKIGEGKPTARFKFVAIHLASGRIIWQNEWEDLPDMCAKLRESSGALFCHGKTSTAGPVTISMMSASTI